jgi:glycine oxidase
VKSVAVVGAGVLGRLVALRLTESGWRVTLIDRDGERGERSCSWTGAGMLSPYCEREAAERIITDIGLDALERWPAILQRLARPVFYREAGSLVVAHGSDRDELDRLRRRVIDRNLRPDAMREVRGDELRELEPEIADKFSGGLYFPYERHIDNRDLLAALLETLRSRGVECVFNAEVQALEKSRLKISSDWKSYDWVVDCRGNGAATDLKDLRGVRGELFYLHAPEVNMTRPTRLMHPRYSVYIVPRANHVFVLGATMIESDDMGPVTVRSSLELLSAAYSVHTGFAEARVLESSVNLRPAFPDNHPRFYASPGLLRINGLFRHGFLISPTLAEFAVAYLERGEKLPMSEKFWREE